MVMCLLIYGTLGFLIEMLPPVLAVLTAGGQTVYLKSPDLRLVKDPSIVIGSNDFYANQRLLLPAYRDAVGHPARGWSRKYIHTRRFNSDQSAWIYYRRQDLRRSLTVPGERGSQRLCIWPGGCLIVIESYRGGLPNQIIEKPLDIAVMAKNAQYEHLHGNAFYSAQWSYARFTSSGDRSMDSEKARECHQCHSIALHLTGDLVFTRFP
jgi:hypothetical protein